MTPLQAVEQCRALLRQGEAVCLVTVSATAGSVPREQGAWMAVWSRGMAGTIGGGRLEFEALRDARDWLQDRVGVPGTRDYPLGPALGQCCGGRVQLSFGRLEVPDLDRLQQQALAGLVPVALFGGGHVGHALVRVLTTLPLFVHWIDSRDDIVPADDMLQRMPNLLVEHSDPVGAAVDQLAPGSHVLAMSYSHAEDFEIVLACLERRRRSADLPLVGMIGSRTKWATFSSRLRQRGYSQAEIDGITCPIGLPGIEGKEPEVIAIAVAAQLLQRI